MRAVPDRLRGLYGAGPPHVLALAVCFALAGYAALRIFSTTPWPFVLAWFAGCVVAHDLVLFPLYAVADRALTGALRAGRARTRAGPPRVSPLNHLRVPFAASGLLLLLFFPMIAQWRERDYTAASGRTEDPYLGRWLLVTAALFAGSAVLYALRLRRAGRDQDGPDGGPDDGPDDGSGSGRSGR
ncbi:hypothetical protein [Actinomadura sp. WMMB 499]|uniref:hypothetical protein n=1 Tax=Actinomadura sp. WMMB 499 TaxID=1219491 RepID=UPI001C3F5B21|nr:hypothetical protein [Actinomadura sp. WMMB 499]